MLNALRTVIAIHLADARKRAELRALLASEDHVFRDIGLTRADVEAALEAPSGTDAWAEARRLARVRVARGRTA